jgi:hypothetical protein
MVSECISEEYARASPARYMTKYVTSGVDLEMPQRDVSTYMEATHGRRQYDAAGEWRPLGIGGDETPPEQKVVGVARRKWRFDEETGELWCETVWGDASGFFSRGAGWREWYAYGLEGKGPDVSRFLNQYGTMLREPEENGDCSDAASRWARDALELALLEAPWQCSGSQ